MLADEDTKKVVVASTEELKGIRQRRSLRRRMGLIPSTTTVEQKKTFNRVGDSIVKAVEVKGPNPVSF